MVKLIKLVNGTEVMGKLVSQDHKTIVLDNPIQINYKSMQESIPMVSVTRYLPFADTRKTPFLMKNVLNVTGVIKGMEKFYYYSLNNFQTNVDKMVDRELNIVTYDASKSDDETKKDVYASVLERLSTNSSIN